jgi:hypothetical protein
VRRRPLKTLVVGHAIHGSWEVSLFQREAFSSGGYGGGRPGGNTFTLCGWDSVICAAAAAGVAAAEPIKKRDALEVEGGKCKTLRLLHEGWSLKKKRRRAHVFLHMGYPVPDGCTRCCCCQIEINTFGTVVKHNVITYITVRADC